MYKVYCDGIKIYDLYTDLHLIEPVLELELNNPGTFEFTMPADHPYFDLPQKMLSRITIERDDEEIFRGRIIEEDVDFYNQKKIYCEGELGFLNDSIQRPAEYHNISVRDYFKTLIEEHNAQVEEDKQFELGYVLISDDSTDVYRYTNYNSTLEEMKDDLIENFGGYIRVRNEDGHRYLDYVDIDNYGVMNEQIIRFGVNLLDYTQTMDLTEIATVIIPLGARLEESPIEALDMRLTVESVNGGSDAIESEEAVKTYGRIVKTVIWDDVTQASNLLSKGKKYLEDYQWDNLILEVTPVDMHDIYVDTETFHLGDQIRVISSPHGLDRYFPLSAMTIHLESLDQNVFTLGTEIQGRTLSSKMKSTSDSVKKVEDEITPTQSILNQAREQATNLITAATHGYVVVEPDEILIMNTNDKDTATQVWRWNMGGLGYSSTGYDGDYGHAAITMDGMINADYILTGELTANIIKTGKIQDVTGSSSWDLDSGEFSIKSQGERSNLYLYMTGGEILLNGGVTYGTSTRTYDGYSEISGGVIKLRVNNDTYYRCGYIDMSPQSMDFYNTNGELWCGIFNGYSQTGNSTPDLEIWGGRIYVDGNLLAASDECLKTNIKELSNSKNNYEKVFEALEPITFEYKEGDCKQHIGFSYQNTVKALEAAGIDPDNSALVDKVEKHDTGEVYGGIEYNEIVALLVYEVQNLKAEVEELKSKLE